ncbi:MAG: hypothetical protein QXF79_07480, partial [Ignisphaera sp.]
LNNGAIEKLFICEDHSEIDRFEKLAQDKGATVLVIPPSLEEYKWFKDTFDCVSGIARYPLNM